MYNYSKISKIYIRNFRNLGDVEIDFTKSPIVTLLGDNEAGKTSVIKAFGVCSMHAYTREQKEYIRDYTTMFGVAIQFEDGRRITRIKEQGGVNSYKITDADNNVLWSSNRVTDGLPKEVQDIMGLIEEPETGEFLHIRTYEDRLLFVDTPNSTNYKVMYNGLKVEQLTKAIKMGSNEVNSLKKEITSNEDSIDTLNNQLNIIEVFDIDALVNIREQLKKQKELLEKMSTIKDLIDKTDKLEEQLGLLVLIDKFNLQQLDLVLADKLNRVGQLTEKINELNKEIIKYNELESIGEIWIESYKKALSIIEKINVLEDIKSKENSLLEISNLEEINEYRVGTLNRIKAVRDRLDELESKDNSKEIESLTEINLSIADRLGKAIGWIQEIDTKKTAMEQSINYIEQVTEYMKSIGVAVESCPKCGEAVIFDIDKMNGGM
jgi:hypothetical protein